MKRCRLSPIAFLLLIATPLAACGGASEREEPEATAEAGNQESESAGPATGPESEACPPEAEIVAIVGQPVQSKPGGAMCFYETADFTASVTIMRIAPSQADQVEREMRDAAAPYEAEVEGIDVGDRGHAWGSPGYGQGYAVSGDRGWMADVSVTTEAEGSQKDAVVRILERMIG
jgi:hypothetical protein